MKFLKTTLIAGLLALTTAVHADSLFDDLGGKDAIARMMTRLVELTSADPRTAHQFEQTKKDRLARLLTDQVCELSGGPCKYRGVNMKKSHIKLGITEAEFNALVEQLQQAMDEEGVPFHTQNRLLALLAPMKRDIVER
ncbi:MULTISPECIES: group I truncated hemoglobin [Kordiimonas]|jgi:hemoglobin|uniref:Hemoglobin n=1 Tax=Kordiimonas lacus TaxID=637679 RepID=A0A1G6YBG9_9PROT|nr:MULTISPECIES: group 1 truncated hemoglobin [Kordiimonas]SDD87690.1 hemoglobin [Kordiimonas lacus]